MTTSRATLYTSLAAKVPGAFSGTASSESTTSYLFDTDDEFMAFAGEGGQDLTGFWVVRGAAAAAGDRVRRVAAHDQGLGRATLSRVYTNGPSGETYTIWPPDMRPALIDQAINDGLARLTYRAEESITPVAQDNSYALASYTWITNQRDVKEVWYQYTSSNMVYRNQWPWWKVYDDSGTFTLHLQPPPYSATGAAIILEGVGHYASLSTDAATTAAPADWVVAAAQVELYRKVIKDIKGQANAAWGADYIEARREFNRLSRRYAPRTKRRVQFGSYTRMPSAGSVSRGEYLY